MDRKKKLAKLILIESESFETAQGIVNSLVLAQEIYKDAVELAKLVENTDESPSQGPVG
jgi:predicted metal-binding transcription factor (methanogenesis marker protein 9)